VLPGREFPAGVLIAGVPGRVIRELDDVDRRRFADTAAHYVSRAARHRAARWDGPAAWATGRDSAAG
jgi:carbonic anhydrase/acetyltransferase-like protein (isoleucine patch superfamily)